jgi:hypothetical protein
LIRRKILDNAVDEVSEALSRHMAPPAIWIVVVPTGVAVLLWLHNPPRSPLCGFLNVLQDCSSGLSLSFEIVPKS